MQGPPQVSSQQSIQPPEAAEGESQRPRVPLERVELLERPLARDPGTAQVSSPASQMRMAACNPRELGGKWEGDQEWGGRDQSSISEGKGKGRGNGAETGGAPGPDHREGLSPESRSSAQPYSMQDAGQT